MDSREFGEWMAFYKMNPWGSDRDNLHAGIIASTVANVNRNPKRKRDPYVAKDFLLSFGGEKKKKVDGMAMFNQFKALAKSKGIKMVKAGG